MRKNALNSLTLLLLLGVIWGTGYSIARFATTHGVPPLGYSFWQSIGPALLIGLVALGTKSGIALSGGHLRYYFIAGLTGIVIPNTNMYLAAPHLPAGLLAVVVNTVPIIAYPLALWARTESFNSTRLLGVACALFALMLLVVPSSSLPSRAMIPWVLTSLVTPFSFAFCAVYLARFRPATSNSFSLAAGTLLASAVLLFPIVLFTNNLYALNWPLKTPDQVILLEIILSSMGYVLLFQLIKIAGPVYYSLVDTIVTLTGLFWGYVLFQEKLNEWTSAAVLLILLGLYLVTKRQPAMIECAT